MYYVFRFALNFAILTFCYRVSVIQLTVSCTVLLSAIFIGRIGEMILINSTLCGYHLCFNFTSGTVYWLIWNSQTSYKPMLYNKHQEITSSIKMIICIVNFIVEHQDFVRWSNNSSPSLRRTKNTRCTCARVLGLPCEVILPSDVQIFSSAKCEFCRPQYPELSFYNFDHTAWTNGQREALI